jgi:hypothetical protein
MEWILRLVGTGTDGQSRSADVMNIKRPDGLWVSPWSRRNSLWPVFSGRSLPRRPSARR